MCDDYVSVRRDAIDWLKKHYPVLCEKSGLCERIGGKLYTRTTLHPLAGQHINQGSFDAAADAYEAEYNAAHPFKREPRYIVFKIKDTHAYLNGCEIEHLQSIGEKIAWHRVVVEQDWPEFEPTWAAIEARMTGHNVKVTGGVTAKLTGLAPEGDKS